MLFLRLKNKKQAQLDERSNKPYRNHPVRKALACLAVILALCIPPVFVNSAIGYLPLLIVFFLMLLSYVYVRLLAKAVVFGGISKRKSCQRNTDIKFLIRFRNGWPLVCTRVDATFRVSTPFGTDDVLNHFSFSLGPTRSHDFEFGVRFAHVGAIEVGVSQVVLHDPLGLFVRSLPVQEPDSVEVLPRVYPVDEDLVHALELSESTESAAPINRDGLDYMGVREYQLGDPIKTIHWKLSSRMDELYTRLYETSGNPGIDILCGLHSDFDEQEMLMFTYDAIMELALSLHNFGLIHSIRVDLLFYDAAGEICRLGGKDAIDHRELLRRMPMPSPQCDEDEIAQLITEGTLNAAARSNLIICTPAINARLSAAIIEAQGRGKRVVVFLVVPEHVEEETRRRLEAPLRHLADEGVPCASFTGSDEMGEVRLG